MLGGSGLIGNAFLNYINKLCKSVIVLDNKNLKIKSKNILNHYYDISSNNFDKEFSLIIKKYKKKTNMRKPGNGMILKALKHYKLKAKNCFMIGDQKSDYLSAKKTNIDFEYKKKYQLDLQIKKIFKSKNI